MNRIHTLTVGIPAYNEEENIQELIRQILSQRCSSVVLREIIIVSDGSTDKTVKKAREVSDERIRIFENTKRQGVAESLNKIRNNATGDILIILNADISLPTPHVLEELASPIREKGADLVSCTITECRQQTFLAEVLQVSMEMKRRIFAKYRKGASVYTCFGPCRAFSKKLYQAIHFPTSIGEDAYSYFFATQNNFSYIYLPLVSVHYAPPQSLDDHIGQSQRFYASQKKMQEYFGEHTVRQAYRIPVHYVLFYALQAGVTKPMHTLLYLLILAYSRFVALVDNRTKEVWDVAKSSKVVAKQ